ncbi:MAG TPA: hypothetical protein VJ715_10160 [Pyrinomonadaceae bacterium]|nr:hypothetical protein [Pyrinomonadaceae bacterium]
MNFAYRIWRKLRHWILHNRLRACRDIVPIISESLDRSLPLHRRVILKLHLFVCTRCVCYLRQLLLMRAALRTKAATTFDEDGDEPSLSAEARERIHRALNKVRL